MLIPLLVILDLFRSESWGSLDGSDDGGLITHEDLFFFRGRERCVRCPGHRVCVSMESALPVFDSEIEAGEDLQPSQDHPGWGFQGANPGECPVVSTQNKGPV